MLVMLWKWTRREWERKLRRKARKERILAPHRLNEKEESRVVGRVPSLARLLARPDVVATDQDPVLHLAVAVDDRLDRDRVREDAVTVITTVVVDAVAAVVAVTLVVAVARVPRTRSDVTQTARLSPTSTLLAFQLRLSRP